MCTHAGQAKVKGTAMLIKKKFPSDTHRDLCPLSSQGTMNGYTIILRHNRVV